MLCVVCCYCCFARANVVVVFASSIDDDRLVAALARDLQQSFYAVFYRIVDVLLALLNAQDPGIF